MVAMMTDPTFLLCLDRLQKSNLALFNFQNPNTGVGNTPYNTTKIDTVESKNSDLAKVNSRDRRPRSRSDSRQRWLGEQRLPKSQNHSIDRSNKRSDQKSRSRSRERHSKRRSRSRSNSRLSKSDSRQRHQSRSRSRSSDKSRKNYTKPPSHRHIRSRSRSRSIERQTNRRKYFSRSPRSQPKSHNDTPPPIKRETLNERAQMIKREPVSEIKDSWERRREPVPSWNKILDTYDSILKSNWTRKISEDELLLRLRYRRTDKYGVKHEANGYLNRMCQHHTKWESVNGRRGCWSIHNGYDCPKQSYCKGFGDCQLVHFRKGKCPGGEECLGVFCTYYHTFIEKFDMLKTSKDNISVSLA